MDETVCGSGSSMGQRRWISILVAVNRIQRMRKGPSRPLLSLFADEVRHGHAEHLFGDGPRVTPSSTKRLMKPLYPSVLRNWTR